MGVDVCKKHDDRDSNTSVDLFTHSTTRYAFTYRRRRRRRRTWTRRGDGDVSEVDSGEQRFSSYGFSDHYYADRKELNDDE